jgi:ergothioneine biosynthesis protein EgtB
MNIPITDRYLAVRKLTIHLIERLSPEDTVVQPTMDVSPPKWHLAHTTWFFENFILKAFVDNFKPFNPVFDYLFNSYYQSQGTRVQRDMRGFHPRPLLHEIIEYREKVDMQMLWLVSSRPDDTYLQSLVELGIHHEQQHQELLMTDLKYIWSLSPLYPVYHETIQSDIERSDTLQWLSVDRGIYEIGNSLESFHYDNEAPLHKCFLDDFDIASRPVTVGEYLEFMEAGGYRDWQYWLHEGWQWLTNHEIHEPSYWKKIDGQWHSYTLNGLKTINESETLTHVSFYEADAFARWKGVRLPTEQEWEVGASLYGKHDLSFNFLNNQVYHPTLVTSGNKAFLGQVWEWTNSAYLPYPGFKPWSGGLGEYNGKFMINQMVLRGGSCVTPHDHIRLTYRNFFHPHLRWQFTGIRLAKNKV